MSTKVSIKRGDTFKFLCTVNSDSYIYAGV